MQRDLAAFNQGNYRPGRGKFTIATWYLFSQPVVKSRWTPVLIRIAILRLYGARIGKNVNLRSDIKIHFPWNLTVGNNCWIGESSWFINHAPIIIHSNVAVSQQAIICSSGHDFLSENLEFKHATVELKDGAWVCLGAKILAGSIVGENSVISAGETWVGVLQPNSLYKNSQITKINYR